MKTKKNNWVTIPFLAATLVASLSCSSATPLSATQPEPPANADVAATDIPREIKLISAVGSDYLVSRYGAGFNPILPAMNCTISGTSAEFTPTWDLAGPNTMADASYCIYQLQLRGDAPATIELTWDGPAPDECYIGLANWDTRAWDWSLLPASNELAIADPAPYADELWRCHSAVVVLGQGIYALQSIAFPDSVQASAGYTLFAPLSDTATYLIDMDGNPVHSWESAYRPGNACTLAPGGHLLRLATVNNPVFSGGGIGGRIEEYDWDGNLVWSFDLSDTQRCAHHDFELLPDGNILLIAWNKYTQAEAIQAGRDPADTPADGVWSDCIIELEPAGTNSANIVWEWDAFDHLIQEYDASKDNYGTVADHPELIDLNFHGPPGSDWLHTNAVYYNADLDQIVLSIHNFSELWIIDHSTTTAQAAGHSGGLYGQGGDLLYRWGNPRAYDAGVMPDQQLFGQHDAQWIADGRDGAGDILIYNNGMNRPAGDFSSITQITPPVNPDGTYQLAGNAYGPSTPTWEYVADPATDFYSSHISSAQRLSLGTTLVCCGAPGWLFEVSPAGEIAWEYTNTYGGSVPGGEKSVFRAVRYGADYPGIGSFAP